MKKIPFIFFYLFISFQSYSQNYVSNGDFETHSSCPTNISQIIKATPWFTPTNGTPDYYSSCSTSPWVSVPSNIHGYQYARSGYCYAGLFLIDVNGTGIVYREYIEVPLVSPLTSGVTHHFQMYISHADFCKYTTDAIGVYFSNTSITGVNNFLPLPYSPQISNTSGSADSSSWKLISGNYTANGGEMFLLIGNFKNDVNTPLQIYNPSASINASYVYIDDVSLVETATIIGSNSICLGQNTILTTTGIGTHNWNTGDTTSSINVNPLITTTYSVVVSNGGYSDTAFKTVTVFPIPIANINGIDTICLGQITTLTASGGSIYNWNTGESDTVISVNPTSNTTYTLIVSNDGCSDTTQAFIIVNPLPIASITGIDTICNGQNTILTANGGSTYNWNTGATTSAVTVSPLTNTSYSVTVYNNNTGCSNTASQLVTTIPLPSVSILGDTPICVGETVTLNASGVGNFLWNTGDTTNIITTAPTITTTYFITASNFCGDAVTSIIINVNQLPVAAISIDTTIFLENCASLNAVGGTTYSWIPASGLSCTNCPNPIASPPQTTTYTVTVTDANGCSATDDVTIKIDCGDIFVPNFFSPNNDSQNDLECIYGKCIESIIFAIFDRWGDKVFETNDKQQCWDGTYKGKLLDDAVFAYFLKAKLITGEEISKQGNLSLIK